MMGTSDRRERGAMAMRRGVSCASGAMLLSALVLGSGCSVKRIAVNTLGDAMAGSGSTFASDNDPELVRDAAPFSLKLMEALLTESPDHEGLLLAAAGGFAQYSYAFVQQDAERIEDDDFERALELGERARRLYLRARDHALRGLELEHPGFTSALRAEGAATVAKLRREDVPFLYWAAASWGAAISMAKHDPDMIVEQPLVELLIDRALELDEAFGEGAIHTLFIAYEMARQGAAGDPAERARHHFERAMELSGGQQAAPLVGFAESVMLLKQDRTQFVSLLRRALAIDPDADPESRLMNLIMQRRARWLLTRVDDLILAPEERE